MKTLWESALIKLLAASSTSNPSPSMVVPFFVEEEFMAACQKKRGVADGNDGKEPPVKRQKLDEAEEIQKLLNDLLQKNRILSKEYSLSKTKSVILYKVNCTQLKDKKDLISIAVASPLKLSQGSSVPALIAHDDPKKLETPKKSLNPLNKPFSSPSKSSPNSVLKSGVKPFKSPSSMNSSLMRNGNGLQRNKELSDLNVKKKALETKLAEAKEQLRKTKLIHSCCKNGEMEKLKRLSIKWTSVCQDAIRELQGRSREHVPKKDILMAMGLDYKLLNLNQEDDEFD